MSPDNIYREEPGPQTTRSTKLTGFWLMNMTSVWFYGSPVRPMVSRTMKSHGKRHRTLKAQRNQRQHEGCSTARKKAVQQGAVTVQPNGKQSALSSIIRAHTKLQRNCLPRFFRIPQLTVVATRLILLRGLAPCTADKQAPVTKSPIARMNIYTKFDTVMHTEQTYKSNKLTASLQNAAGMSSICKVISSPQEG